MFYYLPLPQLIALTPISYNTRMLFRHSIAVALPIVVEHDPSFLLLEHLPCSLTDNFNPMYVTHFYSIGNNLFCVNLTPLN